MTPFNPPRRHQRFFALALGAALCAAQAPALAGPGAHGPNGEHLDSPVAARAAAALPRLEAASELFELVATLNATELVVLIDRFATNEPVLAATLEVESGGLKAPATFRAEQGDYAVAEPRLLALLRSPGEHGLVLTLVAGKDSDLLDGTLVSLASGEAVAAAKDDHGHAHGADDHGHPHGWARAAWIGAAVAALGLIGGVAWWRRGRQLRRRRDAGLLKRGL